MWSNNTVKSIYWWVKYVEALFVKVNVGAAFQDFNSGVLVLEDGTYLTCCYVVRTLKALDL